VQVLTLGKILSFPPHGMGRIHYHSPKRQEATARSANRRLPVSFKALIRRASRLAVMHANNDSLGVRSASVSGSDAEGRPSEVIRVRQTGFLHLAAPTLWAPFLGIVERIAGLCG
jgi:hypothetical protein